jgi:hypothetical protein
MVACGIMLCCTAQDFKNAKLTCQPVQVSRLQRVPHASFSGLQAARSFTVSHWTRSLLGCFELSL